MSSPSDPPLASLDEEIHRLVMSLSNLRAKRNLILPVFRLPPDILTIIFIRGARQYYESDYGGYFTSSIPTWVNVSYVCSHWRNVALNCPILWTYHFNVSLRWTEELLLRSQEALLKISCKILRYYIPLPCTGVSLGPSLLEKLLNHSERIQELRLDVPISFLPDNLCLWTPRLEKLEIDLQWDISGPSIQITDGEKFPLHTLKLIYCTLPWYSLNLSGLKTLHLCDVRVPSPLNMDKFLSVLSGMKNLTVLHLEHALHGARGFLSSGGLDVSPRITLPHLTLLAVIAPLSTVVALISCVNIPLNTELLLRPLLEFGSTVGDFAPIFSFLGQHFGHQSSSPIFHSLCLEAHYFFRLTFTLVYEPLFKEVCYNTPLTISLGEAGDDNVEFSEGEVHHLMRDICSSLPLRNVQTLQVCYPWSPPDFWMDVLGRLDGLRHLKLSHGNMPDLSLLSLPARKSEENTDGQPIPGQDLTSGFKFVPALEELELHQIRFLPDHMSSEGSVSEKSLHDLLSARKEPQVRLTMTECSVSTYDSYSPMPPLHSPEF